MNIKKKNEAEIKCLLNLNKNPLLENNLYKSFSLLYFILEKNTRKEMHFLCNTLMLMNIVIKNRLFWNILNKMEIYQQLWSIIKGQRKDMLVII